MEPYEITMTDITGVKMLASNLHHRTDTETSLWNGNAVAAVSAGVPGDTNNDGMIDKPEVIAAYRAYVADPSDKTEMIAIFQQYVRDAAGSQ